MHAAAQFAEACGGIDAVINNAMLLRYEPVENITPETLIAMTAIGINGSVWGAQALLAHYDAVRGGAIVNMASPVAEKGFPNTAAYSLVKGAIVTLTKVLAAELGPRNVRVNAIAPGSVPTPGALGLNDKEEYDRRTRSIPLRRLGREAGQRRGLRISALTARRRSSTAKFCTWTAALRPRGSGMSKAIPEFDIDPFSRESVMNARASTIGCANWRPWSSCRGKNITMLARYEHVAAGLRDWKSFSSTSRPWHDPNSVRPELLLTDDPPKHTRVRAVVANALSPRALSHMAEAFAATPGASSRVCARAKGEIIDAVDRYHAAVRLQGAARSDRPAARGPRTHVRLRQHGVGDDGADERVVPRSHEEHRAVIAWAGRCCNRENLAPGSLGMAMYEAADRGEVTAQEANLLVGILLSAAADTTVLTLANTIRAFCEFPDQYQLVRSDRTLVRAAFEESLRWDSPSRMAGRIAMKEVQIEGYRHSRGRTLRTDVRRRQPRPAPLG